MKAILIVDIPNDYDEYGNGKWYITGDLLRIGYEEKNGSFIGKKLIENKMVQLKPMPQKKDVVYEAMSRGMDEIDSEWVYRFEGYNVCIDEILGEQE